MNKLTYGQRMNFILHWECKLCINAGATFYDLRFHLIDDHIELDNRDRYKCIKCNLAYNTFGEFLDHCLLEHFVQFLECKTCGEYFETTEKAKDHYLKANHSIEELDAYWINNPDKF